MVAALVCMTRGHVWNRRRGRADWSERALAHKTPIGAERRRVRPYLRHGTPAPDPETAHLTVRVATELNHRWENPWYFSGVILFLLGNSLILLARSMIQDGFSVFLWLGISAFSFAVCFPFYRQAMLDRARLALATNQDLASWHQEPDAEPPHPRER
ncbi:hypothetical protein [Nocardiopsis sp. JB363]|uniref:hypothetical protein n=1 Tax=Nocardiopsis sp. JB363 TaxID=1434837 RepID=UPI00097B52DC|nr:hypothetical protein [Nocardiopsis sp. JB363]SIO91306.1 hypothetical protein BQ8420_31070 [Nocardiopsis sp. JB363]